jgi:hypothetical protein
LGVAGLTDIGCNRKGWTAQDGRLPSEAIPGDASHTGQAGIADLSASRSQSELRIDRGVDLAASRQDGTFDLNRTIRARVDECERSQVFELFLRGRCGNGAQEHRARVCDVAHNTALRT